MHEDGDGGVAHAELRHGDGMVMLGAVRDGDYDSLAPPPGSGAVYIAVADADALPERAKEAGAEIVTEPFDTDYGSRDFSVRDAEGVIWNFGTYAGA